MHKEKARGKREIKTWANKVEIPRNTERGQMEQTGGNARKRGELHRDNATSH